MAKKEAKDVLAEALDELEKCQGLDNFLSRVEKCNGDTVLKIELEGGQHVMVRAEEIRPAFQNYRAAVVGPRLRNAETEVELMAESVKPRVPAKENGAPRGTTTTYSQK